MEKPTYEAKATQAVTGLLNAITEEDVRWQWIVAEATEAVVSALLAIATAITDKQRG